MTCLGPRIPWFWPFNGDVAFRILPDVVARRSNRELRVEEVRLRRVSPGDACEQRGRPNVRRTMLTSLALLVPRLVWAAWGSSCQPHTNPVSLDAVDLFRVMAVWNTCCFHWEMAFPFKSFSHLFRSTLWPKKPSLDDLLQVRLQTCMEGLYVMISLFLVLQCNSWQMLCQRLLRKVGRQLVVMYFIASVLPLLLHTPSPMNCLREPDLDLPVLQSATDFFFIGSKWTWALQMDLHIFLLVGSLGVLRRHLPLTVPAASALYWAYIIGLTAREEPCHVKQVANKFANHIRWITHFSFWMNWFPTSLLLLNLDTCFRKPQVIYSMGRLKQILGPWLGILIGAKLLFCYWISTKLSEVDWRRFGFSDCPSYLGENSPSMAYVLSGLAFHLTVFTSLHLAAAPDAKQTAAPTGENGERDRGNGSVTLALGILKAFCKRFRNLNFTILLWHHEAIFLGQAHCPGWIAFFKKAQKEESTLELQLLFFAPMAFGTYTLAWLTYHCIEKPWARLFRKLSECCPAVPLYVMFVVYFTINNAVWYANGFTWTSNFSTC